jgi:hypothetical protein
LEIIKVFLFFFQKTCVQFQSQTQYHSTADRMAAWGLKNSDLMFVRHELRSLLFRYLSCGKALVEYE